MLFERFPNSKISIKPFVHKGVRGWIYNFIEHWLGQNMRKWLRCGSGLDL